MSARARSALRLRPVSWRPRLSAWLTLCLLWLAGTGCAVLFPPNDPFANGAGRVNLGVDNRHVQVVTLYVISDLGSPVGRRLGEVGGNSAREFNVPWDFAGRLSVRIDLLGGGTCTTAPITVDPGDEIELKILPDFARSMFCQ